jgi:acetolactate synthase-1/2/3 large subunit
MDAYLAEHWLQPLVRASRPVADAASIERAADVVARARRPIVIAGNGAYWGEAGPGLRELTELDIPVMTRALSRGMVPEDLRTGYPWPIAFPAAREADAVIIVGSRLGSTISFGSPPYFRPDAPMVQIDIHAAEIGRNRRIDAPVVGDAGAAVGALAAALRERTYAPDDPSWIADLIAPKLARFDELGRNTGGMVHPVQMARELQARMPEDAIFIGDGANCLHFWKGILRMQQAPAWMDHDPFGSMGVGLPMAIGVVAAQQESASPRPVFVGTGDGALGQYIIELATASLHGLPFFLMVANDGSWGSSRNITRRLFNGFVGVDMRQSRYDLVAQGLECHGEIARTPADVGPAFDRALAAVHAGTPALVNVLVDREMGNTRGDPLEETVPFNIRFRDWRPAEATR